MKYKFTNQFFKSAATVLVCTIVSISNLFTTLPAVDNSLKIENYGNGKDINEELGISPQNDYEEFENDTLD